MSELENLRHEARKRLRAAGKKVSYNRRVNGVELTGSPFDPRVPPSRIDRYNKTQLNSLINKLDNFTSRKQQFVKLGTDIVPKREFSEYKKWERKYNANVRAVEKMAEGKQTPFGEQNIYENDRIMHDAKWLDNHPDFFRQAHRSPEGFYNRAALKTLTGKMKKRSKKLYLKIAARDIRKRVKEFGLGDQFSMKLSDAQLVIAWQHGGLAHALAEHYINVDSSITEGKSGNSGIIAQINEEDSERVKMAKKRINTVVEWAFGL